MIAGDSVALQLVLSMSHNSRLCVVVSGDNTRPGDAEVAWPRIIGIQAIPPEFNSIE